MKNYFCQEIVDEELLSEDFNFCNLYRETGGNVWAAPWCKVTHQGAYNFKGDYISSTQFDRLAQGDMLVAK